MEGLQSDVEITWKGVGPYLRIVTGKKSIAEDLKKPKSLLFRHITNIKGWTPDLGGGRRNSHQDGGCENVHRLEDVESGVSQIAERHT
jgi:hypothetical protein